MNAVLNCPMDPETNDARASTVREYLVKLLAKLWEEQDEFSGKRPFGNSGWESDLEIALVKAGMVAGEIDDHGYLVHVHQSTADALIRKAIQALGA